LSTEHAIYGASDIEVYFTEDSPSPVPIKHFDYTKLDDPLSHIREAIAEGRTDVDMLIRSMVEQLALARTTEAIGRLLGMIYEAPNARQRCVEIGIAAGIHFAMEKSGPQWAKEFHVRKQAIHQAVNRIRQQLGLRKTRTMRSEQGRKHMSKAYHQKA
jgi:hypothetical protein